LNPHTFAAMKQPTPRCRWSVLVVAVAALSAAGCGWAEWPGSPGGSRGWDSQTPVARGRPLDTVPYADRPGRVIVMSGDSVERLSQRYGTPARSIIELNNLQPPYRLYVGQSMALPRDREHVVAGGETLSELAERYGLDMPVLASANGLTRPYAVFKGQRLRIPEAQVPAAVPPGTEIAARSALADTTTVAPLPAPPPPSVQSQPPPSPPWVSDGAVASPPRRPDAPVTTAAVMPKAPAAVGAPPPKSGGGFLWPTSGKVISRFGSKGSGLRNDGINIAAERGSPVRAAEAGVVAYAGNELKAFGKLVLIKHDGGWVTTYAHNDAIKVSRGDIVQKGQVIAEVGNSGSVSTPQLHFEMRKGKKAVDPLQYLPPGRA
jgi:murein DD-endopeptidase MepM/ murein hydrolase activator NlpD